MSELDPNSRDRLVSVAKGAAGALPFVGSIVSEILDSVIPELRFERVVTFLKSLDDEVKKVDARLELFEANLRSEHGLDLFEEGVVQAARAVSEDRKARLARLVARALSEEELGYAQSRKLLNLYRELTDPEIVWLIFYSLNPVLGPGPHADWVKQHPEILEPISREMGAPREQHEQGAIQDSYKETLVRLGLTTQKSKVTQLTTLGRLLIRYIEDGANDHNES
ncbi:MAG: hypothetical protein PF630_00735 [Gammaproteobacteria bacterium]|jgi:hypothetical protein|nr:hypothetical protein [Gammaproteobacteria bacterium]